MKNNILVYFICMSIFFSCKSIEKEILYKEGDKEKAILNVINDFSKTENNSKGYTYHIIDIGDSEGFFHFLISEKHVITVDTTNIINLKSKYFPSKYRELNNRLYTWADSTVTINKDIIDVLNKYNGIDSTIYKIQKGILSGKEWPTYSINEKRKSFIYSICKKKISIYDKNKVNKLKPVNKWLIKKCEVQ
ncbi:hypothetical protein NHF50_03495 [Flavobacterium sp. NRK F10]|uniref:hypothetical protein n=1 Tax=Flavobacterium sp. NRK F10 TaxID=2954931 RepID=UPI002090555F|nr:hypothetical protein [Flavobacterium sp. NRK F10]MCO6174101.1 hypothetical protein [Flavobacterium sp. NRK F10]